MSRRAARTVATAAPRPSPRGLAAAIAATLLALLPQAPLMAQSLLPLSDYQVIIDRKPFGELAQGKKAQDAEAAQAAAQEAQAAKEQEALAKQIDLVAVNITLRGTISVGFVDKSVKPATSHYLSIGETEAGFTVESADYVAETATISKGGVKITLKLGSGIIAEGKADDEGSGSAQTVGKADEAKGDEAAKPRIPTRVLRRPGMPGAAGGYRNTVLERRRAENAAAAEEEAQRREDEVDRLRKASDSAAAKREHDMNYKLLLEGKEPISEIHLTPEEERELESKGLLAPREGE